jgi:hypothetical protein
MTKSHIGCDQQSQNQEKNPKAILGSACAHWFRADQGVTVVGGKVTSWRDIIDPTITITQADDTKQPVFTAQNAAFSNKSTIDFDGTNDFLAGDFADLSQPYHIFMILSTISSGTNYILTGITSPEGVGFVHPAIYGPSCNYYIDAGTSYFANCTYVNDVVHIVDVLFDNTNSKMAINGRKGDLAGTVGTNVMTGLTLCEAGGSSGFASNSKIAEVIIVNRSISQIEKDQIVRYLKNRYMGGEKWVETMFGSSLVCHFRADQGVTTVDGYVSKWEDITKHLSVKPLIAAVNKRPYFRANLTPNGKTALDFDGTTSELKTGPITLTQPEEIFISANWVNTSQLAPTLFDGDTTNAMRCFGVQNNTTTCNLFAGTTGIATTTTFVNTWKVYDGYFNGDNSYFGIGDTAGVTSNTGVVGTGAANGLTLGVAGSGTYYGTSQVYEIIILNRGATAAERDLIVKYMSAQVGI